MTDRPEGDWPGRWIHELALLDGRRNKLAIAVSRLTGILLLVALVVLVLHRGDVGLFISVLV
ncbi:hypothetical protein PH552_05745 [Rhizobium sp. CNPSo 3968]|uniref:hypothetical protein n=1 Tax=Rhizobium sp. CNPSo 3968 TaxID=3021408 RepID=UPI000DE05C81|nr:hypothetical protein [Rhizobium sp. CNPSo 3968]MDK4718847.1 hypothetical protein [Rhizobium sp. CNPSo 3968]